MDYIDGVKMFMLYVQCTLSEKHIYMMQSLYSVGLSAHLEVFLAHCSSKYVYQGFHHVFATYFSSNSVFSNVNVQMVEMVFVYALLLMWVSFDSIFHDLQLLLITSTQWNLNFISMSKMKASTTTGLKIEPPMVQLWLYIGMHVC